MTPPLVVPRDLHVILNRDLALADVPNADSGAWTAWRRRRPFAGAWCGSSSVLP